MPVCSAINLTEVFGFFSIRSISCFGSYTPWKIFIKNLSQQSTSKICQNILQMGSVISVYNNVYDVLNKKKSLEEFIRNTWEDFIGYISKKQKPHLYFEMSFVLFCATFCVVVIHEYLFYILLVLLLFASYFIITFLKERYSKNDNQIQNGDMHPFEGSMENNPNMNINPNLNPNNHANTNINNDTHINTNQNNTSPQEGCLNIQYNGLDFSQEGKKYVIRSNHWKFLSVQRDGTLKGNRDEAGECEEFEILKVGNKYTIKCFNNKYLKAQSDGTILLVDTGVRSDEQFEIIKIDHKYIIKSNYNMFLSARKIGYNIVANSNSAQEWEEFYISEKGKKYYIKSSYNKFLNAKADGTMRVDLLTPNQNAEFEITQVGPLFIIKSYYHMYFSSGGLIADRTKAKEWEHFRISQSEGKYIISYKDITRTKVISTTQDDKLELTTDKAKAEMWEIIPIQEN